MLLAVKALFCFFLRSSWFRRRDRETEIYKERAGYCQYSSFDGNYLVSWTITTCEESFYLIFYLLLLFYVISHISFSFIYSLPILSVVFACIAGAEQQTTFSCRSRGTSPQLSFAFLMRVPLSPSSRLLSSRIHPPINRLSTFAILNSIFIVSVIFINMFAFNNLNLIVRII